MIKQELKKMMESPVVKKIVNRKACMTALNVGMMMTMALNAFAYTVQEISDPTDAVLKLIFMILRVIGAGLAAWGFAGLVTARINGDSSSITGEIGKIVGGVFMIGMPSILQGVGLIG